MRPDNPLNQLTLGVDTHLDVHVAVLLNGIGKLISTKEFPVCYEGYKSLLKWTSSFGHLACAGIEGTGTYGAGLCKHLLDNEIWGNDQHTKNQEHTACERLAYHQQHSLPIMDEIKCWSEQRLANGDIEENSSLGKAVKYFIKHFDGLTYFYKVEGAKIDNNQIEAMLKIVVRDRKNAMFHKTRLGATIGDVITSVIATASESGINVFDYFTTLQRDSEQVRANPENYLPWNYLDNS